LSTVGLGQPVYLEAQVDISVPASQIAGVTWALTQQPSGSTAVLADSPLGANVPIYEPTDQVIYQVAGRKVLRPDVAGVYFVTATVTTVSAGTATVHLMVTGSSYVGIQGCSLCHNNTNAGAPAVFSMVAPWSKTLHAQIFSDNIDGKGAIVNGAPYPYTSACWGCHTVGYDANATVANGGFTALMAQLKWTAPTVLQAGNFAAMPKALQNVANIQCENCHGAGSSHATNGGDTRLITVSLQSGACGQCHGEAPHHVNTAQWLNSAHAATTRDPSGAGREACVGCHTANGFIGRVAGATTVDTTFNAINCQTCHEPHGLTTPTTAAHQLRTLQPVTLKDGTTVTNAGLGTICMNCHQARVAAATYASTTPGSTYFGPHEGPQTDMLEGVNGYTYGKEIPSSAHSEVVGDTCVTCHMQSAASTDPGLTEMGGHTFKLEWAGNATNPPGQLVGACQTCHGPELTSLNFPLFDYDGDGVIDGAQTEVQHLLNDLALLLPPVGQAKTALTIDSTWTQPQLEAAYNYLFVQKDGSLGIHNMAYTVGLLKASIEDLTAKKGN
jgi:hypothetical protein